MTGSHTAAAVAAAVATGRRFGLPADRAEILHERSNVLVRMGPVVARVPGTTRLLRPDPAPWLARDVAVSTYLTERGVRVVSPTTDPPAGPHFAAGLPVTLWHWTRHDPDHRHGVRETVRSLAQVHDALRDYPGELPPRGPVDELLHMADRTATLRPARATGYGRKPCGWPRISRRDPAARCTATRTRAISWRPRTGRAGSTSRTPGADRLSGIWRFSRSKAARRCWPRTPAKQTKQFLRRVRGFASCSRSLGGFFIAERFPHRAAEAQAALRAYFS